LKIDLRSKLISNLLILIITSWHTIRSYIADLRWDLITSRSRGVVRFKLHSSAGSKTKGLSLDSTLVSINSWPRILI
jgi:hypothetical protein